MYKRSATFVVPVILASVLLVMGCDRKSQAEAITIEKDIVMDGGAAKTDQVLDDFIPVPAPKSETLAGDRPSKNHIWVPGEWNRDDDTWLWEDGRWMKPPYKQASWMKGHWSYDEGKWHWSPGLWVVTDSRPQVDDAVPPPEPLTEDVSEKPSDKNHWVAGHWDWDGHWYWEAGYWTDKPHPDADWVAGHWDESGWDGEYRWIGGHWQLKS